MMFTSCKTFITMYDLFEYLKRKEVISVRFSEHEDGTLVRVRHELLHTIAQPLERRVAPLRSQHEQCEHELNTETPEHGSPDHLKTKNSLNTI